ncbi:MAG: tRNA (cmo5U34)-methyltransferase [Sulfurospirillum sp.]|jgi:tRNA (cmo5U34)-methyltransferase|nr:tRNA (cmo5U34)-methyltransferase [Sulfurospirillum sp.]DAB33183.1 MAG TPA: carboxy-S-adenosyl-L-methionine synthase CmoA [Sulfurospirillum sp. UBA12182]
MDKVFSQPIKKQFEFDENVASVFDDMLDRSIPFYKEVLQLVCDLVILNTKKDSKIIDLGCSTANTLLQLFKKEQDRVLVGVDNSAAMLENARKKIQAYGAKIELIESDITTVSMQNCDAVIANYMLQFIRPLVRNEFVKKIYDSLNDKGIFVLSEKIIFEDKALNKQMIDLYYDFKRSRGYSDFEIAQKREALENVLVPYTKEENIKMLKSAGFTEIQSVFQFGNFITFIAKKS